MTPSGRKLGQHGQPGNVCVKCVCVYVCVCFWVCQHDRNCVGEVCMFVKLTACKIETEERLCVCVNVFILFWPDELLAADAGHPTKSSCVICSTSIICEKTK